MALRDLLFRQIDCAEVAFAIRRQTAIDEQVATAILNAVALLAQLGNSFIGGANAIDFIANVLRVCPGEQFISETWIDGTGDQHGDFPLVFSFGDSWPRNFRAVDDASLSAGFSAATALLVASTGREEHDAIGGIDQHGGVGDDILMNAKFDAAEGTGDEFGFGQSLLEISATLP